MTAAGWRADNVQAAWGGDTSPPIHQEHGKKHLRWLHCPEPPTQPQQISNVLCVHQKTSTPYGNKLYQNQTWARTKELLKFLCFFLWNGSGKNKVTHPKGITHFPSWLQSLRTDGQYIQRVKTNLASPDPKYGIPPSPIKKVRRKSFAHLRIFLITGKKRSLEIMSLQLLINLSLY